ncbi:hypothetical protein CCAX7_65110 [Capsulimonas corticalis]|uniref:Uncharacterized protein n=1 Tax=Capsulimonas corticalis TaxID=2219043 RepID=A0A402CQT6_9BACT|nr:hypothetical protein [Capsulimonas corticalis]BDI34460.1 hypothetical protein CCAX7_65110 [Capsulimonas corticalis]
MAAHFWIFPWLALFFGLASFFVASLRSFRASAPPGGLRPSISALIVWAGATALATWLSLRIGAAASVDFIAARGVLLGSLSGLLLVGSVRRVLRGTNEAAPAALVVGWGVAVMAGARLWLTHGELSGLTGLILGVVVPLVVLGTWLFDDEGDEGAGVLAGAGLAFLATLSAAVQLGFTRAKLIEQMFWPDVPLLLGAALCLGLIIAVLIPRARLRAVWIGAPYLLATVAVGQTLAHERTPLKLLGVGALTFALLYAIARQTRTAGDRASAPPIDETETAPLETGAAPAVRTLLPSLALLVMAVTVSYAYWAGYGVVLMLLAGWAVAASAPWRITDLAGARIAGVGSLLPAFVFGAIASLHRLLLLQNSDALDVNAVTDAWDFFALSLGAILPFAAAEAGAARGRIPGYLRGVFWLLALAIPIVVADYVLAARAGGGLLLGAALAALFSGFAASPARGRVLVGSLTVGALTLIMTPIAAHWDEPTRRVRTLIVIGAVVLLAILQLLPARRDARPVVEG